jgi:hypothetical protein
MSEHPQTDDGETAENKITEEQIRECIKRVIDDFTSSGEPLPFEWSFDESSGYTVSVTTVHNPTNHSTTGEINHQFKPEPFVKDLLRRHTNEEAGFLLYAFLHRLHGWMMVAHLNAFECALLDYTRMVELRGGGGGGNREMHKELIERLNARNVSLIGKVTPGKEPDVTSASIRKTIIDLLHHKAVPVEDITDERIATDIGCAKSLIRRVLKNDRTTVGKLKKEVAQQLKATISGSNCSF